MPKEYDRCVKKVKRSLKKYKRKGNPYAICRATMNGGEIMAKRRKVHVKGYLKKVKGKKTKVRVKGYSRKR